MKNGTVKWFDEIKGYGFLSQEDGGDDLFVHHSEISGNHIQEGDKVEYEIGEGRKGPCAIKVSKI